MPVVKRMEIYVSKTNDEKANESKSWKQASSPIAALCTPFSYNWENSAIYCLGQGHTSKSMMN